MNVSDRSLTRPASESLFTAQLWMVLRFGMRQLCVHHWQPPTSNTSIQSILTRAYISRQIRPSLNELNISVSSSERHVCFPTSGNKNRGQSNPWRGVARLEVTSRVKPDNTILKWTLQSAGVRPRVSRGSWEGRRTRGQRDEARRCGTDRRNILQIPPPPHGNTRGLSVSHVPSPTASHYGGGCAS